MKLVAYLRVSTDDKGQDPERQRNPILARTARDGHEIVAWVTDEKPRGLSSGGIPAMEREGVKEAVKLAKTLGARGLIVESVDRWSRVGWQDVGISLFLLESDHELQLLFADVSGDQDGLVVELLTPIMATVAKLTRKRLREATKSGMAKKKAEGAVFGRPLKPSLSDAEWERVAELTRAGCGLGAIAREISRGRGALDLVDPKARKERSVTAFWVRLQLALDPDKTLRLLSRSPPPSALRAIARRKAGFEGPLETMGGEVDAPA